MKKYAVLIALALLFIAGCVDQQAQQQADRQFLVQRFQAAYPDNWQQKLLEYDIEQQREAWRSLQQPQVDTHNNNSDSWVESYMQGVNARRALEQRKLAR